MALNDFELTIKTSVSVNQGPNVVLSLDDKKTVLEIFNYEHIITNINRGLVFNSQPVLLFCSDTIPSLRLERQMKGVMRTRPAAYRFAHSANDRKFVGVGTWWDGRKRWSRGKSGLEGAAALATSTHLSPADDEGECRGSCLR